MIMRFNIYMLDGGDMNFAAGTAAAVDLRKWKPNMSVRFWTSQTAQQDTVDVDWWSQQVIKLGRHN